MQSLLLVATTNLNSSAIYSMFSEPCQIQTELTDEIAEYSKFNVISEDVARLAPNEKYVSLVDIGQKCFVASVVEAPKSSVYVHVGLGFFAELPWSAAVAVSGERINVIQKKVSNTQDAIERVQADMAEVMVRLMFAGYSAFLYSSVLETYILNAISKI